MRRQRQTKNNIINYNILDNINENAPQSHFDTLKVNTPPKPQKHTIQSHIEPQSHTESITTVNYAYNIKALQQTCTDIIKGLEAGTSTTELLLIAIQGIDLLTGTHALYEQTRGIYSTIYTDVLKDKNTTRLDLADAIQRLDLLQRAEPTGADEQARIKRAIAEHKKAIEHYNDILNEL